MPTETANDVANYPKNVAYPFKSDFLPNAKISSIDSTPDDSLGLNFIAGKFTFDTQIYQGMAVAIKGDLFYTQMCFPQKY